jgi:hypothetical protein
VFDELGRAPGRGGVDERGPSAFARVGEQRELRHDERRPTDRREIQVRLALGVAEDPQPDDLRGELLGVGLNVVVTHPDEQQVAGADRGDLVAVNRHRGTRDTLQYDPHYEGTTRYAS